MSRLLDRLRVPTADSSLNTFIKHVLGNKSDAAAAGAVSTTESVMAYIKQLVGRSELIVASSNVVSSGIPNNTQTGGAITGAASGDLILEDIIFQTDGTGLAAPTNIEISCDNANGKTGAGAPIVLEPIASFGANLTVSKKDTTHSLPMILESGKKLYIHGDDAAGTGTGEVNIYMIFRSLTAGASISGADIAAS